MKPLHQGKDGEPNPSRVQAVVDFFGPTDLTRMGGSHDNPNSPEATLLGGPVQDNKDKAKQANPITYVGRGAPPFLILHGTKDNTVPFSQSQRLAEALIRDGNEVTFVPVKGAGHGGPAFLSRANVKLIVEFFDRHLRPDGTSRGGVERSSAAPRARSR